MCWRKNYMTWNKHWFCIKILEYNLASKYIFGEKKTTRKKNTPKPTIVFLSFSNTFIFLRLGTIIFFLSDKIFYFKDLSYSAADTFKIVFFLLQSVVLRISRDISFNIWEDSIFKNHVGFPKVNSLDANLSWNFDLSMFLILQKFWEDLIPEAEWKISYWQSHMAGDLGTGQFHLKIS